MDAHYQQRLNATFGAHPDWFWDWVEISQLDEEALPEWFRTASSEDLITFWRMYFTQIQGQLFPEYDGFFEEEGNSLHLTEEDMADFNNWVIVQGKSLWTALSAEARLHKQAPRNYDSTRLAPLFQIFQHCRQAHASGTPLPPQTWLKVTWPPRWGYFPGDTADFIFEERFGETLWEQLD